MKVNVPDIKVVIEVDGKQVDELELRDLQEAFGFDSEEEAIDEFKGSVLQAIDDSLPTTPHPNL